jgi:glycosyltransferase involved in cell wall biosynthesis
MGNLIHKYSIILPVRNGGEYVKECINSILAQTYTYYNLIVLDNNSTDGTRGWIEALQNKKIAIIPSGKDLTIEENWERIKNVKKNEFITLIGHDDILHPNFLQVINDLIENNPKASLYHTHFNLIDSFGKIKRPCVLMPTQLDKYNFLKAFLTKSIDLMGTGYVMRAVDYDSLDGIPTRYPSLLFADFELWLKLTAINYEAIASDNCFAFRVHQSTTSKSLDAKMHEALEIFVDFITKLSNEDKNFEKLIVDNGVKFLLNYCKSFSHRILRTPLMERNNITVNSFIDKTKLMAVKLGVDNQYHPEKAFSIRLAKIIDGNSLLRNLFLLFKKVFNKPILKN